MELCSAARLNRRPLCLDINKESAIVANANQEEVKGCKCFNVVFFNRFAKQTLFLITQTELIQRPGLDPGIHELSELEYPFSERTGLPFGKPVASRWILPPQTLRKQYPLSALVGVTHFQKGENSHGGERYERLQRGRA